MDSQPKTQRSSREKTKCKHTVSNPNYSTGLGWKWGKRRESSPFYRGNLGFLLSFPPHGRASTRPQARTDALPRPRGPVAARRVSTRVRTDARSRGLCGRANASAPRRRGRGSTPAGTRVRGYTRTRADVRGRPDEKDVWTDIFIQKHPL
jgi:hypothetical protein